MMGVLALSTVLLLGGRASFAPQDKVIFGKDLSGAMASLPALPSIKYPFALPSDPGNKLALASLATNRLTQGDDLYYEPVVTNENGDVLFEYGFLITARRLTGAKTNLPTFNFRPSIDSYKVEATDPKNFLISVYTHSVVDRNPRGIQLRIQGYQMCKGAEFKTKGPDDSLPLAYDTSWLWAAMTDLTAAGRPIFLYPLCYLSQCTFPDGKPVIPEEELVQLIKLDAAEVDVNEKNAGFNKEQRFLTAACEILNARMRFWAKQGLSINDVREPKDDFEKGNSPRRVFGQILLPAQERIIVRRYVDEGAKMKGPDRLLLRMTMNRVLLDRVLGHRWVPNQIGINGQWRNAKLQQYEQLLVSRYGNFNVGAKHIGGNPLGNPVPEPSTMAGLWFGKIEEYVPPPGG